MSDEDIDWTPPEGVDEKERTQWILDKIFEIRRKQLMSFEEIAKKIKKLDADMETTRNSLLGATDKLEVMKLEAALKSYSIQKQFCSETRYCVQRMHLEEARLEKELIKMQQGS